MDFMSNIELAVKRRTDEVFVGIDTDTYHEFLEILYENVFRKKCLDMLKTIFETHSEELIVENIASLSEKEYDSLIQERIPENIASLSEEQIEKFLNEHFEAIFKETIAECFEQIASINLVN